MGLIQGARVAASGTHLQRLVSKRHLFGWLKKGLNGNEASSKPEVFEAQLTLEDAATKTIASNSNAAEANDKQDFSLLYGSKIKLPAATVKRIEAILEK